MSRNAFASCEAEYNEREARREQVAADAAATCQHGHIDTWRLLDGKPSGLWGCRHCRTKFVPITEQFRAETRIAELEAALNQLRDRVIDEYDRIYISGVLGK